MIDHMLKKTSLENEHSEKPIKFSIKSQSKSIIFRSMIFFVLFRKFYQIDKEQFSRAIQSSWSCFTLI